MSELSSDPEIFRLTKGKLLSFIPYILVVCLIAGMVVWLNLSWRPDVRQLPPDSGFYAYYARAILHGQLPYRDLWDNKPPLGYYLNALGLLVFGQTPWGVWWSSVLWMTGCVFLCFLVIKKLFDTPTALISSFLFLVGIMDPQVFQGGNLTEVYALAPQLGTIGVTYLFFTSPRKTRFAFLAGLLTACAILIKQPTISLGIAAILVITVSTLCARKIRDAAKYIGAFALGLLGLLALVASYWLAAGAISAFFDGAFRQGFASIGGSQANFRYFYKLALSVVLPGLSIGKLYLLAILGGGIFLLGRLYNLWLRPVFRAHFSWVEWLLLLLLAGFPLLARRAWPGPYSIGFWMVSIAAAGLLFIMKFYRIPARPKVDAVFSPVEWTWLVAVLALPAEVLMVSLGGRYYGHYFTTMIPALVLAAAYPIWRVAALVSPAVKSPPLILRNSAYIVLAAGTLVWGGNTFIKDLPPPELTTNYRAIFTTPYQLDELQQYIVQTTQPTDEVLVWHIHLGINFVTGRSAPSRFLYPLNLFIPPSAANTKLKEFIDELESHPPELIVVQKVSSLSLPFVNQPLDRLCDHNCTTDFARAIEVPEIRHEWLRLQQFFDANYAPDTEIYDWIIYRKLPR